MKKLLIHLTNYIIFLLLAGFQVNAQISNFNYTIANDVQMSDKVLEFDLFLLDTDSNDPFELAQIQAGIIINSGIYNSGTIGISIVAGSSQLSNTSQHPTSVIWDQSTNAIKLTPRGAPGAGAGSIISQVAPGTRICRLRITNSVPFTPNSTANLTFNFPTTPYPTKVSQYISGINTVLICNSVNCFSNASNIILNPPLPPPLAYAVTGTGSYCEGTPGRQVGLADSESGVTYSLYKNAGPTPISTLAGTGSALNFGNQLFGTYTVSGTNSGGTTQMTGSAVITEDPLPVATGTISGTSPVCQGQSSVSYSVPVITNATSYSWNYTGTGASITGTGNSVTITFASNATSGNLTVRGVNACGNGAVSSAYGITVNPLPGAAGSITGSASVCQGQSSVSYNVSSISNASSYIWAYTGTGATISGSGNTVTISFASNATTGNLTVRGNNSCGNGAVSPNYLITVASIPGAAGSISGNSSVCQSQSSVSYSVPVIPNASSYSWIYSGTGATISGSTNSITISFASNATSGDLTVRGVNSCGNGTFSSNYPITVGLLPGAAGAITGTPTVCQGQATVAFSVPPIANATSYLWNYTGTGASISGSGNSVTISFSSNATSGILTVRGVNTCGNGAVSSNYTVTVTPLPVAAGSITGTASVCQGQSSVAYNVPSITNATGYLWAYSGTGATITGSGNSVTVSFASNATSGNLTVQGSNFCGNGIVSSNYGITVNSSPAAAGTITGSASVCQGQSSVSYSVPAIANVTSYSWVYSGTGATISGTTNPVTISFASNATSGNLTVRGVNSCGNGAVSSDYAITVNTLPGSAGTISGTSTVCQGQSSVLYSVTAIANATSYLWVYSGTGATITGTTNSVTIAFASNATSGNLTVRGVNTCGNGAVSANYPVAVNPLPGAAGAITGSASVCQGQSSVPYSVPGIANASSYEWTYSGSGATISGSTNPVTISFASNATSGNLTVRGVNSCGNGTFSANYPVTVNTLPGAAGTITGSASVCHGQTSVSYSVAAIASATSYSWIYSGTGATITGSGNTVAISFASNATSGNLTVRGVNACGNGTVSTNYVITVNPLPTITISTPVTCAPNLLTYSLSVTVSGGIVTSNAGTVTNAGGNIWTITNVPVGTNIIITVNNGTCLNTLSVTAPNCSCPPVDPPVSGGNKSYCSGSAIPSISATVPVGETVDWYNAASGGSPLLSGNTSYTPPTAGNYYASARVTATGCVSSTRTLITVTMNPLPTPLLTSSDADNTFCPGTSITFTASGGTNYNFRVGGTSAQNGTLTTYTTTALTNGQVVDVIVTNANGCTATSAAITNTVSPVPTPSLTSSDSDNRFCEGTSVTFTASGGTSYNFRVGGVTVQSGALATYTTTTIKNGETVDVIVTNAAGCSSTSTGILNIVNPKPELSITTTPSCSADLASYSLVVLVTTGTVTTTAGIATNTSGNFWSITGVPSGTNITVTATSVNACQGTIVVNAPVCACPVVPAPVSGGDKSYCAGGIIPAINATVLAGETVDWYNAQSGGTILRTASLTYTPTAAGTYYAAARNTTTNCVSGLRTAIAVIMNPIPVPTLTSSDADNIFCSGTSITFTAGGGISYNFRVAGVSVQNGVTATYTTTTLRTGQVVDVIVTGANGCVATSAAITNSVNSTPTGNGGAGGNECDLDFIFKAVPSFGTGTWTLTSGPGTAVFTPNANAPNATVTVSEYGTYTFTWTEVSGTCSASSLVTVNFYKQPVAKPGTGGNNCGLEFYFSATLDEGIGTWSKVSGPGNVTFSPDPNTPIAAVTVTQFGSYTFRWTVVVNGVCSSSATVVVNFIQQTPANAGSGGAECDKDFILNASVPTGTGTWTKVSGPGNAVFSPNNNQRNATVTVDQFGAYRFAWTVVNVTCSSSDVVDVIFRDLPSVNAGPDSEMCKGSTIQLNAQGTGSFAWTPAELLNNPSIKNPVATPVVSTTFKVVLTDQYGCKNSDNILIEVREKPIANAGTDQLLEYVFETTMDAQTVSAWETGLWSVIAGGGEFANKNSAKSSATDISVGVNKYSWTVSNRVCPASVDTVTVEVKDFLVPTLITPNMDGINDYFVLRGLKTLGKTEITVFDRRGAQVYRNSNYDNSWNGVDFNENPLVGDTYYYVLKSENGKSVSGYIVIRY